MRLVLRLFYRAIKYVLLVPFLLLSLFLFSAAYLNHSRRCAALPNGLILGYGSFLDARRYALNFHPTLLLPDGTPLLAREDYVHHFYFSRSTVYGVAGRRRDLDGSAAPAPYRFLYREDVGLALETENPERYKRLRDEAGRLREALPQIRYAADSFAHNDIKAAYDYMSQDPAYRRENCPLSLFPDS